jgi:hypothetical protein
MPTRRPARNPGSLWILAPGGHDDSSDRDSTQLDRPLITKQWSGEAAAVKLVARRVTFRHSHNAASEDPRRS